MSLAVKYFPFLLKYLLANLWMFWISFIVKWSSTAMAFLQIGIWSLLKSIWSKIRTKAPLLLGDCWNHLLRYLIVIVYIRGFIIWIGRWLLLCTTSWSIRRWLPSLNWLSLCWLIVIFLLFYGSHWFLIWAKFLLLQLLLLRFIIINWSQGLVSLLRNLFSGDIRVRVSVVHAVLVLLIGVLAVHASSISGRVIVVLGVVGL